MNTDIEKPPRPVITYDIINQAAQRTAFLVPELNRNQAIELANAIIQCYLPMHNGFELTKELEKIRFGFNLNFDLSLVEAMDEMNLNVDSLLRDAYQRWVIDYDIQPPLPIGSLIEQGEITGIYDHSTAHYLVKRPDQDDSIDKSRLLIRFEDAVANKAWQRDNEATYYMLQMIPDTGVLPSDIAAWTDAQCQQVEEWAAAIHLSASDNPDITIPTMPDFINWEHEIWIQPKKTDCVAQTEDESAVAMAVQS